MARYAVPKDASALAQSIAADASRVERCQADFTTIEALDLALAAAKRIRSEMTDMTLALRRQRAAALADKRDAERRNRSLGEPALMGAG